jgi:hypothetical protein
VFTSGKINQPGGQKTHNNRANHQVQGSGSAGAYIGLNRSVHQSGEARSSQAHHQTGPLAYKDDVGGGSQADGA